MEALIFFGLAFIILNVKMMIRNRAVYNFRVSIIDRIAELAERDAYDQKPWRWRYDVFEKVTYSDMLYRFWRPLRPDCWWSNLSFLEEKI